MNQADEMIRAHCAALVQGVLTALRQASLGDLEELTRGRTRPAAPAAVPAPAPAAPAPRTPRAPRAPRVSSKKSAPVVVVAKPDAGTLAQADLYFRQLGQRGSTAAHLSEHLGVDGDAVVHALINQATIRDAGFRRNTKRGMGAVFVAV